jgi:16S rRNA (guanine(966)-N(2))-methyltransferase RsmD
MRVVAGKYKGKRWDVPHTFKARPTTDFAKEGLFNILHNVYVDFDAQPAALDLFCGTGSISLELLSRGCAPVVSVEKDFKHYQYIRRICGDLKDPNWHPVMADVFKTLSPLKGRELKTFDIIFADPPYALENLKEIPDLIFQPEHSLLNPGGIFVLEHGRNYDFSSHPHFVEHRNYGSVNFSFFQ